MSARRTDPEARLSAEKEFLRLSLPLQAIRLRKNGLEFRSTTAVPCWTEMTLALHSSGHPRQIECSGVIVACRQDKKSGYAVTMLFTNTSPHSHKFLNLLAST